MTCIGKKIRQRFHKVKLMEWQLFVYMQIILLVMWVRLEFCMEEIGFYGG